MSPVIILPASPLPCTLGLGFSFCKMPELVIKTLGGLQMTHRLETWRAT